jgi:hypothetical protein
MWFLYSQLLNPSTSRLLVSHSLPSRCLSVPLYFVFTWRSLALPSNFITVVFHYNTSKPKVDSANSSSVSKHCTSKQATQTQRSWSVQWDLVDLIVWIWLWEESRMSTMLNVFGVQCLIVRHLVVVASNCIMSH